ncbi:MAG: EVE domain-containing protein [Chloroflexota bacterium]|nr:EVE domain-containing protein [Chloroflexota bacterium]
MSNTYWLVNFSLKNFNISKKRSFDLLGFTKKDNKLTNKININDNVIFYVSDIKSFVGSAVVNSKKFYDKKKIWDIDEEEVKFPYRVNLKSTKILPEKKYMSGYDIAPSLNYLKRWAPEDWYLAFLPPVHILSHLDYQIISHNIDNALSSKSPKIQTSKKTKRSKKNK